MNVNLVAPGSAYKSNFQNSTKPNQSLNSSFNFKGVGSKNILSAMDNKSIISKAQLSFCGEVNKSDKEQIRQQAIRELMEKIEVTSKGLINNEFNVRLEDGYFHSTTLMVAAARLNSPEAIRLLDKKGAWVNIACHHGGTPLTEAACWGSTEAVQALLEIEDIDVNRPDNIAGKTALKFAAEFKNLDIVVLLLEDKRLDIDLSDSALTRELTICFKQLIDKKCINIQRTKNTD